MLTIWAFHEDESTCLVYVEFGGKVLAPMVKRSAPDAQATSIITMDDIETLIKSL